MKRFHDQRLTHSLTAESEAPMSQINREREDDDASRLFASGAVHGALLDGCLALRRLAASSRGPLARFKCLRASSESGRDGGVAVTTTSARLMERADLGSHVASLVALFLIMMYYLYLGVTAMALEVFRCEPMAPDDGYLYTAFTSFECEWDWHCAPVLVYVFLAGAGASRS